jgi:peptidoglycan/xylan/chitin deacetylase (PgdA/CDA1 family)
MPEAGRKRLTLSFDNGPDPETTPYVLDILQRRGVKTTFFIVGEKLRAHRALAERAVAEGHWIGNHTWSHSLTFREEGGADFVHAEIDRTQEVIGDLAHPDQLFRPYGGQGRLDGALNAVAVRHLANRGYTCITWNTVPRDWRDAEGWPETALSLIPRSEWPLVVLHDHKALAMRRLDGFIGELQDRGYELRQEFPPDCIVMRHGRETAALHSSGVLAN